MAAKIVADHAELFRQSWITELFTPRQVALHEAVDKDDFSAVRISPFLGAYIDPVRCFDGKWPVRLRTRWPGFDDEKKKGCGSCDNSREHGGSPLLTISVRTDVDHSSQIEARPLFPLCVRSAVV